MHAWESTIFKAVLIRGYTHCLQCNLCGTSGEMSRLVKLRGQKRRDAKCETAHDVTTEMDIV